MIHALIQKVVEGSALSFLAVRLLENISVNEEPRRAIVIQAEFLYVALTLIPGGDWMLSFALLQYLAMVITDDAILREATRNPSCMTTMLRFLDERPTIDLGTCYALQILHGVVSSKRSRRFVVSHGDLIHRIMRNIRQSIDVKSEPSEGKETTLQPVLSGIPSQITNLSTNIDREVRAWTFIRS
eukprot:TRINITY_DN31778_c0_g1_i3.p1 TRINITY_DN31778_c0_g1~~TRINITY_DN31778_c0_g1_i3.p1  ORF type:complete len:185 (+),score=39.79 TRINITY_DN31778_c0_g1_i3:253-807(+)